MISPLLGCLTDSIWAWSACLPRAASAIWAVCRQKRGFGAKSGPVGLVSEQRMADRGQMNPNLVGPAGFEPAERGGSPPAARLFPPWRLLRRHFGGLVAAVTLEHLPMRDGLAAAFAHRHAVARPACRDRSAGRWCRAAAPARPRRRRDSRARTPRRSRPWSANCAASARCARSFFATTISPVVSLSSRCTMPGRRSPPMPERLSPQCAISALTSVPVQLPAAGWTTRFFGLSMTMMSVVLVDDVERNGLGRGLGRLGRRHVDDDCGAGIDAMARIADRLAVERDRALLDQHLEPRPRQRGGRTSARWRASTRSSRSPASSAATQHRSRLASR